MNYMQFRGPSFTMQVPTNWFVTSSIKFQAMFVAPPAPQGQRANLAISITPLEKDAAIATVVDAALKTQQKEYPEYQVLQEGEIKEASGEVGFRRVYTWYNRERETRIRQHQVFFVTAQMLYTLTATRQDDDASQFFDEIFGHMVETFKFEG